MKMENGDGEQWRERGRVRVASRALPPTPALLDSLTAASDLLHIPIPRSRCAFEVAPATS